MGLTLQIGLTLHGIDHSERLDPQAARQISSKRLATLEAQYLRLTKSMTQRPRRLSKGNRDSYIAMVILIAMMLIAATNAMHKCVIGKGRVIGKIWISQGPSHWQTANNDADCGDECNAQVRIVISHQPSGRQVV